MEKLRAFLHNPATSGVVLLLSAAIALVWANSPWADTYHWLWHEVQAGVTVSHWSLIKPLEIWVNDALMAVFFFVVGLEIKRELRVGHLASPRKALLPAAAAVGGMLVPAGLFALCNNGGPGAHGWGVPMATDIAFAVGVLALLGKRVPVALKVFLVALAIIDDLGAVVVIAVFYTEKIAWGMLALGGGFLAAAALCSHLGVRKWWIYAGLGVFGTWLAFLHSGVHATIAGVLMAFVIPFRDPHDHDPNSTHEHGLAARWQHGLEPWVAWVVMPVFALANAGVQLDVSLTSALIEPVTYGVIIGLTLGKPVGVIGATWLAVRVAGARLPDGVSWAQISAAGMLAGIGFTMALFIGGLAFNDEHLHGLAKIGVLTGSALSGVLGAIMLARACRPRPPLLSP